MPSIQIELNEQAYQRYIEANPFQREHLKKLFEEALQLVSSNTECNTKGDLVEFFQQSPLVGVDLDLEQDKDTGRDIDL